MTNRKIIKTVDAIIVHAWRIYKTMIFHMNSKRVAGGISSWTPSSSWVSTSTSISVGIVECRCAESFEPPSRRAHPLGRQISHNYLDRIIMIEKLSTVPGSNAVSVTAA